MKLLRKLFINGLPIAAIVGTILGYINHLLFKKLNALDSAYNEEWKIYGNYATLIIIAIVLIVMIPGYMIFKYEYIYIIILFPLLVVINKLIVLYQIKKKETKDS